MKSKLKLKSWVKVALLLLPQFIIIIELFLIGINVNKIEDDRSIIIQCNIGETYGE